MPVPSLTTTQSDTSSVEQFRREVMSLINGWVGRGKSLHCVVPVAKMLGCEYLVHNGGIHRCTPPSQPRPQNEAVVVDALVLMTVRYDCTEPYSGLIGLSILDGLLRNERWRVCVETPERSLAFVILIAHVFDWHEAVMEANETGIIELYSDLSNRTQQALREWLNLEANSGLLLNRALACAMFGDAWCSIMLDGSPGPGVLAAAISATKPIFLPGLIQGQTAPEMEALPQIDA